MKKTEVTDAILGAHLDCYILRYSSLLVECKNRQIVGGWLLYKYSQLVYGRISTWGWLLLSASLGVYVHSVLINRFLASRRHTWYLKVWPTNPFTHLESPSKVKLYCCSPSYLFCHLEEPWQWDSRYLEGSAVTLLYKLTNMYGFFPAIASGLWCLENWLETF